ncbi:TonB family protein [Cryomorphaceae bacterium 1068]|nr:TonB family protein [Cryomorphaceae bacterium 1068]
MMNALLYALEANLYLSLFAIFYFFALRKEKNHLTNRMVLLSSILIAWTIPGISYLEPVSGLLPSLRLEAITISPNTLADSPTVFNFSFQEVLASIYVLGIMVGSAIFIKRLLGTLSFFTWNSTSPISSLKLVETDSKEAWSFFNLIALGKEIPAENKEWILEHEKVHVEEKHSADKLLIQLVKIIGWFNPAVYYLEFALEENHEFRADEVVCERFSNTITYSHVLVSQSLGGIPVNLLGNQFSKKTLLKSRIQMINQTKQTGKMKYLLTIPVLAVALLLHSCTKEESATTSSSEPSAIAQTAQTNSDEVFDVVEKMPEFKDGMEGLIAFMSENTVYPKSASAADETGKVFVTFVIDEAGNVTNPEVVEKASVQSVALRNAALETVGKMPAWTPGEQSGKKVKVKMTLPIKFELE